MPDDMEWIVPLTLVRDADRAPCATTSRSPMSPHPQRLSEIRRQVLTGYYASAAMMDTVARRILDRRAL